MRPSEWKRKWRSRWLKCVIRPSVHAHLRLAPSLCEADSTLSSVRRRGFLRSSRCLRRPPWQQRNTLASRVVFHFSVSRVESVPFASLTGRMSATRPVKTGEQRSNEKLGGSFECGEAIVGCCFLIRHGPFYVQREKSSFRNFSANYRPRWWLKSAPIAAEVGPASGTGNRVHLRSRIGDAQMTAADAEARRGQEIRAKTGGMEK